jgi:predicted 2-oxoglutarate/Fe(II)-dependent dioxygenase YbiX
MAADGEPAHHREQTMPSIADKLAALLSNVRRPGDFYAKGVTELRTPRLEVLGVGPLALPLLAAQAEQLINVAERAPYGRGGETLVDTTVRRTWQIGADQIQIAGSQWAKMLTAIVAKAAQGLGVTEPVAAELYKLLIYDEGSHFVSHRDTEKSPGMFATLLVTLPSLHNGGDLLVRHKGREVRLEMRCEDPSEVAFAAFYADCVHEVLPVSSGYRMVLVYNLLRQGGGRAPGPPNHDEAQAGLEALLLRWSTAKAAPNDDSPEKLVFPLEHAYTSAELSFATLKGADAAAGAVLTAAVARAGCDLHVALLTIEESGSAEYAAQMRPSRWRSGSGTYDEEFEIGEIIDSSRMLSGWARPDGSSASFGCLPFDDAELCPADALADMEPDEQHFQEATGNEGASFERTYSRAALVLWPQERRLAVLNQGGLPVTLPYLGELTGRWAAGDQDQELPLWQEAHQLAGHMLRTWQKEPFYPRQVGESSGAKMLGLMTRLRDTEHAESILADIIATGGHGKNDNETVQLALGLFSAPRAAQWLETIVAANAEICPCSCADLLARRTRVGAIADSLAKAGKALLLALPSDTARLSQVAAPWQLQKIDAGFVVDSVSALSRIEAALADSAVDHLLVWPKTFDMDAVILPAVRQMVQQAGAGSMAALDRLRAACLNHLHARVAIPLEAPVDWTRTGTKGCQCVSCRALDRFLADPEQQQWVFKANELDRQHVVDTVRSDRCDVDCKTEKRGRPYSLLCLKNQASYERRAAQRQQDLADLARLAVRG